MLQFIFENETGRLCFHKKPCRMLSVTGLGLPEREFETVTYAKSDGQETLEVTDCARTVTVAADVLMNRGLERELSEMARILYRPGILTVRTERKCRRIACRCTAYEEGAKTPVLAKMVVQFTCDDPAFLGENEESVGIFEREDLIEGEFTLPMMFSSRINEKTVAYNGDLPGQPILRIRNMGESQTTGTLSVTNELSDGETMSFCLTAPLDPDETVTVDFDRREVISDRRGSLIHLISDDTYLNVFALHRGSNRVCVHTGVGDRLTVRCLFTPRYLEAIF